MIRRVAERPIARYPDLRRAPAIRLGMNASQCDCLRMFNPTNAARILPWLCLWFAGLGGMVAVLGRSAVFAMWNDAAAATLYSTPHVPDELTRFAAFGDGVLGGTIIGKWVAAWWLAAGPARRRVRWAVDALLAGLVVWFVVDSAASIRAGAIFNVWMINVVPLVGVGPLLLLVRSDCQPSPTGATAKAWKPLEVSCWAIAVAGAAIAALGTSEVLLPFYAPIEAAFGGDGGVSRAVWLPWLGFVFGPVGGTIAGHFVMLALLCRRAAPPTHSEADWARWALRVVWTSVAAWFVVNSAMSLVHGAAFNVWMINVPAVVALAIPTWWALRR